MKKTNRQRAGALLLAVLLAAMLSGAARAETLQACHRVENQYTEQKADNKSVIRLWHAETAHPAVTEEVNRIAEAWAEELGADLPAAKNTGAGNSRLDVEIRYSRTGLHWMSFMIQARTIYHQKLTAQEFTTRTYNMETGERMTLAEIFDENLETWEFLAQRVRETLTGYWPDTEPDAEALEALCTREALEKAEFTLHGMSMVLHYSASVLYEGKYTLMEVPLYYPEIRDMMNEEAWEETNNNKYYNTCALTFDDGPNARRSPQVLDALMETGTRATYFVIGNLISKNEWIVQREHDDGHAVASHNWHHGNATKSSGAALRAMPKKVNNAMIKAIGIPVRYDRVPGGRYPPMQKAKVNWAYIQWSLDTYDWQGSSTESVLGMVQRKISDGDIILCHDIKPNAPESTRQIVRYLEEQGYMLLTVDELFAKDGVTLERGKVYYRCVNGDTSKKDGT